MTNSLSIKILNYRHHKSTLILLFFCFGLFLIRIWLRGSLLELDEAEQAVAAQHLSPGYPNQPPLYTWLQFFVFQLMGTNLISIALLKYSLLFGCLYYYYQICRLHCQEESIAWCALLAWALIPAISLDLIKDNTHSILALLTSCITWYWFNASSSWSAVTWYLRLGVIIGLGILSKFNYLLFLLILVVSALTIRDYRTKLCNWYLLLTISWTAIIVFPYVHWLFGNYIVGLHSTYKLVPAGKTITQGFFAFLAATLFFAAPCLLLIRLFFTFDSIKAPLTPANQLLQRYHLVYFPLLALVLLTTGVCYFKIRWLIPILFLTPLLLFQHIKHQNKVALRRFMSFSVIIQLVFLCILIYRSNASTLTLN